MQFRDLGLGFKVGGLGFKLGRFTGNPAYDGTPALLEHRPPDHSAAAACPGSITLLLQHAQAQVTSARTPNPAFDSPEALGQCAVFNCFFRDWTPLHVIFLLALLACCLLLRPRTLRLLVTLHDSALASIAIAMGASCGANLRGVGIMDLA